MAEKEMQAMSRLRNPRTEHAAEKPIKGVDDGKADGDNRMSEDGAHEALDLMHGSDPGSRHVVVSHDGYGMTSHGINEDGEHDGPHDHANIEELKSHLGKFFNEEEGEGHDEHDGEEPLEDSGNLY
jgi:hypothetical protein